MAFGTALLLIAMTVFWHPPGAWILLLPVAVLPLVLLGLAFGWALAGLGAVFPDIHEFVQIVLRMLIFLTPVVYPIEVVPPSLLPMMALNPLASILHGIRSVVLWDRPLLWGSWALDTASCGILAALAYWIFTSVRPRFADVV
jgi:lipopolysaccharide transport system permease protein